MKICTLRNQTLWINDTWGKQTKQAEKFSMRWGGHIAPMNDSDQRGIYEESPRRPNNVAMDHISDGADGPEGAEK